MLWDRIMQWIVHVLWNHLSLWAPTFIDCRDYSFVGMYFRGYSICTFKISYELCILLWDRSIHKNLLYKIFWFHSKYLKAISNIYCALWQNVIILHSLEFVHHLFKLILHKSNLQITKLVTVCSQIVMIACFKYLDFARLELGIQNSISPMHVDWKLPT